MVAGAIAEALQGELERQRAGAAVQANPLIVRFNMPIPASAVNTAIAITLPALGAGNTKAAVAIHGFYTESAA